MTKAYEVVWGQKVNFQKFFLCFSPNIDQSLAENIQNVFQIEVVERYLKYLGSPLTISKNRKDIFPSICTRVNGVVAQ